MVEEIKKIAHVLPFDPLDVPAVQQIENEARTSFIVEVSLIDPSPAGNPRSRYRLMAVSKSLPWSRRNIVPRLS